MVNKLTIGQMARLNNITERALRLYHKLGLLVPQYIDEANSYRYYAPSQSRRLNMILQMKSVGIPLKQIQYIMKSHDLALFEAILLEQMEAVGNQVRELNHREHTLRRMLETCRNFLNPPSLRHVFIEYQPKRSTYFFDIEPFDYATSSDKQGLCWENILEQVRAEIFRRGMPVTYFSDVGCIIRQRNLCADRLVCEGAFIIPQDGASCLKMPVYEIKAGTSACMFDRWVSGDTAAERRGIRALLDFITDKGFEICGDYVAEVTAESSVFDSDSRLSIVKMQIPVHITGHA